MKTLHLQASIPADVARAAELLRSGRLVAFATETVYGLGANALSAEAVAGIFAAKQRPAWDPLIVHIAFTDQLSTITEIPVALTSRISLLTSAFWPGPLTLLLPRSAAIPNSVTAGRGLVGVRVPAQPAAHALLLASGLPIAAPSANLFGHTSPTTAEHVLADLVGRIDAVLDAGPTSIGLESTVLDPTHTPMILYRPGAITAEQLTTATGVDVQLFDPAANAPDEPQSLPSPGVGIRHYAPRARLVLVTRLEQDELELTLRHPGQFELEAGKQVGLMLPEGWVAVAGTQSFSWGDWADPEALAHNLFTGLRSLDERGVDVILCPLPPPGGLNDAIRDRLYKAAIPA
jgi:L-threonylcarbamoyladenylate synthase